MSGLGYADVVSMMTTYANKPHTTPSAWWSNLVLAPLRAKGINVGSWFDSINPTYVTQYVARQVAYWGNLVQGLLTWQTLSVVNNNRQRHRCANHRRLSVYFEPRR